MSAADEVVLAVRVPRSALTITESVRTVTQRTSERVLGISRRTFLASLAEFERAGGEVIRLGKLRIVDVERFLSWLRDREVAPPEGASAESSLDADLGLVVGAR